MKMPKRSEFYSGYDFLSALDIWKQKNKEAYNNLYKMFKKTHESDDILEWPQFDNKDHIVIRSIQCQSKPQTRKNLAILLDALAGNLSNDDLKPKKLSRGYFKDEFGASLWCCFVECERLKIQE